MIYLLVYSHKHGEDYNIYENLLACHKGCGLLMKEFLHDIEEQSPGAAKKIKHLINTDQIPKAIDKWEEILTNEQWEIHELPVIKHSDLIRK